MTAAARKAAERRVREDAAKRLADIVPDLERLCIRVEEWHEGANEAHVKHTRHVVVQRAPAVFDLPCCDRHCDGGHDVTKSVLNALTERRTRFDGRHRCGGTSKEGDCQYELTFTAEAAYS